MAYPDFTLSYGSANVTLNNQNIVSWSRAMIEPDANDLYKGIPVRINGDALHRWSLSLIASSEDTNKIKQIYRESTRDRFNKELPGSFEVSLVDNAELSTTSVTHDVLFATCTPKPISCDRYEIEIELIEVPVYLYVPTFSVGGVTFNQSEITSYDSSAVIEEGSPSWQWTLGVSSASLGKITSLVTAYKDQIEKKEIPPYTDWGVSVSDGVGTGLSGFKCEITALSHTVSLNGFDASITVKTIPADADAEALTFSIEGVTFAGKEIQSANKSPLVSRGIEIIPTGATVISDNCGPGVWQWSCSFESTKAKCAAVVQLGYEKRSIQLNEGNWLVSVSDGVNGGGASCAIESASMSHISDKPGKYSLSVDLRQVNV